MFTGVTSDIDTFLEILAGAVGVVATYMLALYLANLLLSMFARPN